MGSGFGVCLLVSSSLPPPLSAGSGLGNLAALLWQRARFLSFRAGFRVVLAYVVLLTPPAQCQAVVWVIGLLIVAQYSRFLELFSFSPCRPPHRSAPGAIWVFWLLRLWHTTVLFLVLSSFRRYHFASPPLAKAVALLQLFALPSRHSLPAPPRR